MTFTVVSTFSGCGGSSLGYKLAGAKILLAVECNANAIKTYSLNFPETPIYQGDIALLSVDEVLTLTKLKPKELDILDGSPPCQGFSTAGKREFFDKRNQLFKEYCRLLEGLQPKCFVMENVSGMIKGKMRLIFLQILQSLKALGYKVKVALLDSSNYGVAQARERLIFIGVRNDLCKDPSFPSGRRKSKISVEKALTGVTNKTYLEANEKYRKLMSQLKPGENLSKLLKGSHFSYCKAPRIRPCMTITKSVTYGKVSIWHYEEDRNITIEEAKRLHSFPDDFLFYGNYEDAWARIGNSVPPLLMHAVAKHINEEILEKV